MNNHRFVFLAAVIGNILEYFDFSVYALFSISIGTVFFPEFSGFVQIILSLFVFAFGFFARPLGGILLGYIGDVYGRKIALLCSMIGMSSATLLIGILPGYNEIGVAGPLLLSVLRFVQGVCLSGEGAGVAIFVLEHYSTSKSGFITSIVQGANICGTLLATLLAIIANYFMDPLVAWRVAFVFGGLMGLVGMMLRVRLTETPVFKKITAQKQILKLPFLHVLKDSKKAVLMTAIIGGYASSIVYLIKTYVNLYFANVMMLSSHESLIYASYAAFVLMIVTPFFGYISDYIGSGFLIKVSCIVNIVFCMPCLWLMSHHDTNVKIAAVTTLAIFAAASSACAYVFVISLFKPEERFSGVGFSYNLGVAIFGGTCPLISRSLVEFTGLLYSPGLYIACLSVMVLVSFYLNSIDSLLKNKKVLDFTKNL